MSTTAMILNSEGSSVEGRKGTHALKITINGRDINFPIISPYQVELRRAEKRGLVINSPSVTFLEHVTSPDDFIGRLTTSKCDYESFARDNAGQLINYSFSLAPSQNMSEEIRNAIREIQIDADAEFLFEYEVDVNQSAEDFLQQLEQAVQWLTEKKSNKILVPVIDMKIIDEDLFLEKLKRAAKKFKRINIVYQSPNQSLAHWGYLQEFLSKNVIWCHMDCVLNRYNSDKISHRVSLYPLGIASSSIAYGFGGGGGSSTPTIYDFDQNTIQYERLEGPHLPSFAEREDRVWINSLNAEIAELEIMREYAENGTLYTNYIPTKSGLQVYLRGF